jgi:hypothetical protein
LKQIERSGRFSFIPTSTQDSKKMTEETYDYDVTCRTCRKKFTVQLFESHEKNLFLVDKKYWFCDTCKKDYLQKQTAKLVEEHQAIGLPELDGTPKMVSWAVKIRGELLNKVDYLKKSLTFENNDEKALSDNAFGLFLKDWQSQTEAKWWIDNRRMNVRDISTRIEEIKESI